MALTKYSIGLLISFILFCNIFLLQFIINLFSNSFAEVSINSTITSSNKSKSFYIKVGEGNSTVTYNQYYPSQIEIVKGDSITWYNGMDVPLAHTVTFLQGLDNMEKVGIPFYVQNSTKLLQVIENTGEPLKETTANGTQIVLVLNSRALNPTVITKDSKVLSLGQDAKYNFIGNEKFVNSGPLLSLDENQNFDYSFSNSFTLVFDKPGLYEYSCLFHPWMIGKVLVKPK